MTTPKIYCAIDTPDLEKAKALTANIGPVTGGIKLGMEFFNTFGPRGVEAIREACPEADIFIDLKFHDIPNTVAGAMHALHVVEPAIMTVHASGGRAMMEDAKAAAAEGCKVVGVTMLTSLDENDLARSGVGGTPHDHVMRLADLAHEAGLDGIVCSGQEVGEVRRQWKDGYFVVPGLRPAGATTGDQKRTVTPRQARDDGASVLVIGRPITQAPDPVAAAEAINESLTAA